ncbi:MAG: hypothetical protein R6U85_10090 [Salinivirgaceae bacterium]
MFFIVNKLRYAIRPAYRFFILLSAVVFQSQIVVGQAIPEHVSYEEIYAFMDELASEHIIILNSAIKPYTKGFILECLHKAEKADSLLNKRQKNELAFYLQSYQIWDKGTQNPYMAEKVNILKNYSTHSALTSTHLGFAHRDSNFTVVARPLWGYKYHSNDNGDVTHFWGGASAEAQIGSHLSVFASVRDNSITEILAWPGNFTRQDGGNYKLGEGGRSGGDYSEMRGGFALHWNWGNVSLVKDHVQWGDHSHGPTILDSRAPSFAMLKMHLKPTWWFEFDYLHGWLVSEVIDSANSYFSQYGESREAYRSKFIAANMYTLHPFRHMSLSAGNSIIYSDLGGPHPAYMIPFMFFKSIDHTLNHGIQNQNSQLFFNASIRSIKHLHVYGSLFVDEFSKTRVGDDTQHNFLSWKGGAQLQNWPIPNVSLTYEFTQTYPVTYKHRIAATTYETNNYGLGHYLSDNSLEHYFALTVKPVSRLFIKLRYWQAFHANEYAYDINNETRIDELPVLEDKTWQNHTFDITASYQLLANVRLQLIYRDSNIKGFDVDDRTAQEYLDMYSPNFYHGHQQTIMFQFNLGF